MTNSIFSTIVNSAPAPVKSDIFPTKAEARQFQVYCYTVGRTQIRFQEVSVSQNSQTAFKVSYLD